MNNITLCVGCYSNFFDAQKRCLDSIKSQVNFGEFKLLIGCNEVPKENVEYFKKQYNPTIVFENEVNIHKIGMMRQMLSVIDTEYLFWFDDDTYLSDKTSLVQHVDKVKQHPDVVLFGNKYFFKKETKEECVKKYMSLGYDWNSYLSSTFENFDANKFFDLDESHRLYFITGNHYIIKTDYLKKYSFPPDIKSPVFEDVMLSQMVKYTGNKWCNTGDLGVSSTKIQSRQWRNQ